MSDRAPDVRFEVPGQPKPLQRNRHRIIKKKDGGQFIANYLPAESRSEQGAVRMFAAQAMAGRPPLDGPLELRMTAFMPIPASWSGVKCRQALEGALLPAGRPDLDNMMKLILDGMQKIAIREDSQIVSAYIWKRYSDRPRVVVEIRCLDPKLALPAPAKETTAVPPIDRGKSPLVGEPLFS